MLNANRNPQLGLATIVERLRPLVKGEGYLVWGILIFGLVTSILSLAVPVAVQSLVNSVAFGTLTQQLIVLSVVVLLVLSFSGMLKTAQLVAIEHLQRRLFVRLTLDLARRIPAFSSRGIGGIFGPEILNPYLEVSTLQKSLADILVGGLGLLLQIVFGLLLLTLYHPLLLVFASFLGLAVILIIFVLGKYGVSTADAECSAKYETLEWLEDMAQFGTLFRSEEGMEFGHKMADEAALKWLSARKSHFRVLLSQNMAAYATHAIASATLLGLGGYLVIRGQLTLGQLVAAELVVNAALSGLVKFGKHLESLYDLSAAMEKLNKLREIEIEETSGDSPQWNTGQPASLSVTNLKVLKSNSREYVIDDLMLDAPPGSRIAIIGENGIGKSILADSIYRFIKPASGTIKVDGHNIWDVDLVSLRSRVGIVSVPRFFHGTLEENLKLGRDVTRRDLRDLLDKLGLSKKIESLPDGLQTEITPNHRIFSYGEMLRLSIAQILLGSPGLLIIDQTLDGVDERSLDGVFKLLLSPELACTIIVLTHDPNIASEFPTTYVLHGGKLSRDLRAAPSFQEHRKQ